MGIDITSINSLEENLEFRRVVASSEEQATEWKNNYATYLAILRSVVTPIDSRLAQKIDCALATTESIRNMFFPKIGLSEEEFFAKFLSIRESYLKGEYNSQKHVAALARVCDGLTMNMDWIHLFSWRLPSADPSRKAEYIRVAKMFLAAFYIERLYKTRENPPLPDPADSSNVFTKLEALFSFTFEGK